MSLPMRWDQVVRKHAWIAEVSLVAMTDSIRRLTTRLRAFAGARDWEQFHTPKNLAMALIVEAAELVEQFQWLTPEESMEHAATEDGRAAIADELADIGIYLVRLADVVEIDLGEAMAEKIDRNEERFPTKRPGADSEDCE